MAFVALVGCSSDRTVPSSELVDRTHLGISCTADVPHHTENGAVVIDQYFGEKCDRIGLAVWLKEPARELDATLAGRSIKLRSKPYTQYQEGEFWEGFRQPAGFKSGDLRVGKDARLLLTVRSAKGKTFKTSYEISCCGGWG